MTRQPLRLVKAAQTAAKKALEHTHTAAVSKRPSASVLAGRQILPRPVQAPDWVLVATNGAGLWEQRHSLCSWPNVGAKRSISNVAAVPEELDPRPSLQILGHSEGAVVVEAEAPASAAAATSALAARPAFNAQDAHHEPQHSGALAPDADMRDFRYDLPDELIAKYPATPRDASRLLVASSDAEFHDRTFREIAEILPSETHLVVNESQVFAARCFASGLPGRVEAVEVMFLSPQGPEQDPALALNQPLSGQLWRCMVRSTIESPGATLTAEDRSGNVMHLVVEDLYSVWQEEGEEDGVEAALRITTEKPGLIAHEAFEAFGHVPLPPYLHRAAEDLDRRAYQTVFASHEARGSVAAATAGLHFTAELCQALADRGIRRSRVALHVGSGTFRPVTAAKIAEHKMHEESFAVSLQALEEIAASLEAGRPLVPVGTTTCRTLESLYWLGALRSKEDAALVLGQWEPYSWQSEGKSALPSAPEALRRLCCLAQQGGESCIRGSTSLCIVPGYRFQLCDALVTNFHQPDSTLMLLVGALAGRDVVRAAYEHAKAGGYRFLSYGDSTLLLNATTSRLRLNAAQADARGARPSFATDSKSGCGAAAVPLKGDRVLLHSCCAPCSGAMIEEMQLSGLNVTIFFYNPNIHPRKEYELRKRENMRYAEALGIPFVDADYDVDEWYRRAKGMEFCPERGTRCSMCFDMRFERTALYAHEHGFSWFTTTNATSRWKDENQVNASGVKAATKYPDVKYWVYNWQTQAMTDRKYRINAEHGFYKQEYCGCTYSLRDSNAYRKAQGLPPVMIGAESYYSDPEADAAEESPEIVENFFRDARAQEELRAVYKGRRRGTTAEGENW